MESNFERFVRAKSTIDDVYTEMRNQGMEPETEKPRTHSRHTSRSSIHMRSTSGQGLPTPGKAFPKSPVNDKKKHALKKESEYGVQGIKAPVIEVAVKAEEIWGPALGGRDREQNLRSVLESVEKHHGLFEVGVAISGFIKQKDYDNIVKEYSRARKYVDDARNIVDVAVHNSVHLTDPEIHQIILTGRMWLEVQDQVDTFKREVWRNLTSIEANMAMSTDRNHQEDHVALISVLLELGVEDNPIWVWLLSRYDYLKNKINSTFLRSRVEIEVVRRRLVNEDRPTLHTAATYLKRPARSSTEESAQNLDAKPIMDLWNLIFEAFNNLISVHGGILGEVIDFWNRAQSFIDGKAQRTLPVGVNGSSRQHHRLSSDGIRDLHNGAMELVDILREHVFSFFADPPIEDISMLFSPIPTETPNTPQSALLSPLSQPDHRFRQDFLSPPPPPSPRRGEAWEEFAFWPPYANALGGVYYLGKLMDLIGTATVEMAAIRPVTSGTTEHEKLKHLLGGARERSVKAVCAAWNTDAEKCKALEDWTRTPDQLDLTRMPNSFAAFESYVLSGIQKMLYFSEAAAAKRSTADVITPPPSKLLQVIRSQFVTSLYKVLSGMVENAEKPVHHERDPWVTHLHVGSRDLGRRRSIDVKRDTLDPSNRVRMLGN